MRGLVLLLKRVYAQHSIHYQDTGDACGQVKPFTVRIDLVDVRSREVAFHPFDLEYHLNCTSPVWRVASSMHLSSMVSEMPKNLSNRLRTTSTKGVDWCANAPLNENIAVDLALDLHELAVHVIGLVGLADFCVQTNSAVHSGNSFDIRFRYARTALMASIASPRLCRASRAVHSKASVMVTADHGNADEMYELDKKGNVKRDKNGQRAKTSHTLNPVPFILVGDSAAGGWSLRKDAPHPGLSNIAATVLNLLGYEPPSDYDPSLIVAER